MTIKDLKPPFHHCINGYLTDSNNVRVTENIRHMGDYILEALNEKWQREYSGKRWIKVETKYYIAFKCPDCDYKADSRMNYCPSCGVKLEAPEEVTK